MDFIDNDNNYYFTGYNILTMKPQTPKPATVRIINFGFYNAFTGEPYTSERGRKWDRVKASNGFYSKLIKKLKLVNANVYGVDVRLVKTKLRLL